MSRHYDYRVTVYCEDNSQTRFGATSAGLADKLARKLIKSWPYAIKTTSELEQSRRVLSTYTRQPGNVIIGATPPKPTGKHPMALFLDQRRQAE